MNRFRRTIWLCSWLISSVLTLLSCGEWVLPEEKVKRDCQQPNAAIAIESAQQLQIKFRLMQAEGTIDSTVWSFGDGSNTITASQHAPTHVYTQSGTYQVRATLTNACGQQKTILLEHNFTNIVKPTVVTQAVVEQGYATASVSLLINDNGNAPITRYGLCWRLDNETPTINDNLVEGSLPAPAVKTPVAIKLTNLQPGRLYTVRAFAQNGSTEPGYGATYQVQTGVYPIFGIPNAPTCGPDCATSARLGYFVTHPGTPTISDYGLVYSKDPANKAPTLDNAQNLPLPRTPIPGILEPVTLSGLTSGSTYYIRPYAKLGKEPPIYGDVVTFTTLSTLGRDLVLHLPFSENGNRSLNDLSDVRNAVSQYGGVGFTTDRFGNPDAALLLDGVDDYISVADNVSLQPSTELSVSLWFRANAFADKMTLYCKSRFTDGGGQQYGAWLDPTRALPGKVSLQAGIKQGSGCQADNWQIASAGEDKSALQGQWQHIVYTYKGRTARLYLNGVEQDVSAGLPALTVDYCPGGELKFGVQEGANPYYFRGAIDNIRVYRRELTKNEVEELGRQ